MLCIKFLIFLALIALVHGQVEQQQFGTIIRENACTLTNGTVTGYFEMKTSNGEIFSYKYTVTANIGNGEAPNLAIIHKTVETAIILKNL